MRTASLCRLLLIGLQASLSTQLRHPHSSAARPDYPTRQIANVTVIDTPLVQDALAFARQHSDNTVWNHVMRSWLFGSLILQNNPELRAAVDPEVHAVAAILHDLGFDETPGSPVISLDRRFEVDGAIAARNFIRRHMAGKAWEERRVQLVWDAIALHTLPSIYSYKETEVMVMGQGINMDFTGPTNNVSQAQYNAVLHDFPADNFPASVTSKFVWLCHIKPATTYETSIQPWGENFVEGYSAVGHRFFDRLLGNGSAPLYV
ncbi:hypothetical protein S7711_02979 [Stachybotrys chartarum IBT 7711]|uniref:Uncharacterized protein n=1 Tax=Stachybotrys chartarum (strain CBS 109288 / IBT 7711) TaxID=1280523 RepID=A0A084B2H6_STACB|nr:hypothetical protein S7711_02979 [Stachybotrys chartarum IBT 7711]KFA79933.1 hypothetical protein S40288_05132 [Stachybotrys chartarum IBT 40288]